MKIFMGSRDRASSRMTRDEKRMKAKRSIKKLETLLKNYQWLSRNESD